MVAKRDRSPGVCLALLVAQLLGATLSSRNIEVTAAFYTNGNLPATSDTATEPASAWSNGKAYKPKGRRLDAGEQRIAAERQQQHAVGRHLAATGQPLEARGGGELAAEGQRLSSAGGQRLSTSGGKRLSEARGPRLPAGGQQLSAAGGKQPAAGGQLLHAGGRQLAAEGQRLDAARGRRPDTAGGRRQVDAAGSHQLGLDQENRNLNLLEEQPRRDGFRRDLLIANTKFFVDTCMEGQSFTIASASHPELEGCYAADEVLGKVPPVTGQYVYSSARPVSAGGGKNVVATTSFFDPSFAEDEYWVLMSTDSINARTKDNETVYCVSAQMANMFNHPSEVTWACDLTGKMEEIKEPSESDLTVACGCPGLPPLTRFDTEAIALRRQQMSAAGRRRKKNNNKNKNNRVYGANGGRSGSTSNSSSRGSSSSFGVSLFHLFGLVCVFLAVVTRLRASRRRTQATAAAVKTVATRVSSGSGGDAGKGGDAEEEAAVVGVGVGVSLLPSAAELTERRPSATATERTIPAQSV